MIRPISAVRRVGTATKGALHIFLSHRQESQVFQDGKVEKGLVRLREAASIGLLCIGLVCCLVACHSDRRESFYPSLADAKKAGAIDRGWIPDFLPESSRGIHEVHDLSPSTTWCAFEFLPSDSQELRKNLKGVDAHLPTVRRVPSPGKTWWPAVLEGNVDVEKIHKAGFEIYIVTAPETSVTTEILLFSIDWTKGQGFFYRTSA